MTRNDFLSRLEAALQGLPEPEKGDILADYDEHFAEGAVEGRHEGDIAAALGDPRTIGKSYRIDYLLQTEEGRSPRGILSAVVLSISLGFFNLLFVLGPFLALFGVLLGLWGAAAGLLLGGAGAALTSFIAPVLPGFVDAGGVNPLFLFFAGIAGAALGLLASVGMVKLSRIFFRTTARYLQFNVQCIRNKRRTPL